MDLIICPYCNARGLETTLSQTLSGYHVIGKCRVCGYACDSDYALTDEASDDLACEFSRLTRMEK